MATCIEKVRALGVLVCASAGALALVSCSSEVTGPSDLGGGIWRLQSMQLAGAPAFTPADPSRFTVEFKADGQVGVVADCNVCGGTYTLMGGGLTVPPMACTLVACAGPEGIQFAGIIDGTSSIQRNGDSELQIQSSEGRLTLRH